MIVVNDCSTCWSRTFNMVARLLTVKDAVSQITNDMRWDSLLTSEWQKFSSCMTYCCRTLKNLQSDTTSMSPVVLPSSICNPGHVSVNMVVCWPDLELLTASMRPYYLSRELSHVISLCLYIISQRRHCI